MALYYLDIETTGLNKKDNKIITIQYIPLDNNGFPLGEIEILKEWESSEEKIVKEIYRIFKTNKWYEFIPVMQNHIFDFKFLLEKFEKYGLTIEDNDKINFLDSKPLIDLRHIFVIANDCQFKGCGLDQMTKKEQNGKMIPIWYSEKKYDLIENYIKQESESFIEAFQIIIKKLKNLKSELK